MGDSYRGAGDQSEVCQVETGAGADGRENRTCSGTLATMAEAHGDTSPGPPSNPERSVLHRARPSASWARPLLFAVIVVVLIAGLGRISGLLPSLGNPFSAQSVDRSQPTLLEAIKDLSEYRAATGQFQVVLDVEEDTPFVPSFVKGERTVFLAGGTVDASVDFTRIARGEIEVSDDGESVTVRLPPARLSPPRIDPERSYVVSRNRGLLDRAASVFADNPTGERELYLLAEEKLAAAAADSDLVERAQDNTRDMLQSMLGSLGFDDVEVTFERNPAI